MEEKLNINEIIKIEELPKIFYELELVGKFIDEELVKVRDLQATEENKNEVKKIRTGINNTLKEFENKRKEIKTKVLEPYNQFNEKYELEIKSKLENASEELNMKIGEIESKQLYEKETEIKDFIKEHIVANHLENILLVDNVIQLGGLKINLSNSVKSLKEQALTFINKVNTDLDLIALENEFKNEIILEYKNNGFDLTKAKLNVIVRHKQLEEMQETNKKIEEIKEKEQVIEEIVEEITTPQEIIEDDEILTIGFTVKGTKEQLLKIKNFIKELGVEYE